MDTLYFPVLSESALHTAFLAEIQKLTIPSIQNIEQTKHMTVMAGVAISEKSYILMVMRGLQVRSTYAQLEARSDTQRHEHGLARPIHEIYILQCLHQTARV